MAFNSDMVSVMLFALLLSCLFSCDRCIHDLGRFIGPWRMQDDAFQVAPLISVFTITHWTAVNLAVIPNCIQLRLKVWDFGALLVIYRRSR